MGSKGYKGTNYKGKYCFGYGRKLHVTKEEFEAALIKADSVNSLCSILGKSKNSIYTYAFRFNIPLYKRWIHGEKKRKDGYYQYTNPKNHRVKMENHLGRKLERNESVHHIDGNKDNNELSNLIVLNKRDHQLAHKSLEKIALDLYNKGLIEFNKETNLYNIK